jgi:hypothetical protein
MKSTVLALLLVGSLALSGVAMAQATQSVGDIIAAFQRGEIKLGDIPARYNELAKTRTARRAARLAELERTLGPAVFAQKEIRDELARHHRILAFAERARLVAETELEGFRRAQTLVRIERMLIRENRRHDETMERLTGARSVAP